MKKAKIATLTIFTFLLVSLVSAFQVGMAGAQGSEISIDGILTDGEWDDYFWFTDSEGNEFFGGYPEFTYYKTNDDDYLYIATIVDDPTPLADANDDIWLAFRLYGNDDLEAYPCFRKGYTTDSSEYGQFSEGGKNASSWDPLPQGVEFGWNIDDSHVYYEWKIPLALLGVSPGGTIKYLTHVREYPKPDGIPRPLNYHPEITGIDDAGEFSPFYAFMPYAYEHQFGDLELEPSAEVQALLAEIEGLNAEIAGLEGQLGERDTTISSLSAQVKDLQGRIDELETVNIIHLEKHIDALEAEISSLNAHISGLEASGIADAGTISALRRECSELEKDLKYWKNRPRSTRVITTGGIGEDGGQVVFAVALGAVGIAAMLCVKSFTGGSKKSKKG